MPRPKNAFPSLRLHRPSGRAVCTVDGRDYYCGAFGSAESREEHKALLLRWHNGELIAEQPRATKSPTVVTITNVAAAFWRIVDREGLYLKNGRPTTERGSYKNALRVLVERFGRLPAAEFGPSHLHELRKDLAKPFRMQGREKLARSTVNALVRRVVYVFRIAAEFEVVPETIWARLRVVRSLRKGRAPFVAERPPIGPVDRETVDATVKHLTPDVVAMVELQWHSGARPGEILALRTGDVDRTSESQWTYTPGSHKTEHHGRAREIEFGPKAIEILRPLLKADPRAFVFPLAHRPFPGGAYNAALRSACRLAGIPAWSANRLRHAFATRATQHSGIESARVALGHSSADVTEIYAERDRERARQLAREIG
jgi:integrase